MGGVGLVELDAGELGVVAPVDPLVAPDPADLVDPLQAAHHQPLEVELGGDAQLEVEPERVVVGLEGAGRGAAGLLRLVQRRGLHLQVAALVEEAPDGGDDAGPLLEGLLHPGGGHQVEVALAVALLDVGQAVPLLGQGPDGLGEDGEGGRLHGELAGLGAGGRAPGGDHVAHVEELEDLEDLLAHPVLLHPDLDLPGAVANLEEGRLAEAAHRQHASGHRPVARVEGDLGGRRLAVVRVEVPGQVGRHVAVAVRVHAELAQLLGLLQPLRHDLAFGGSQLLGHRFPLPRMRTVLFPGAG